MKLFLLDDLCTALPVFIRYFTDCGLFLLPVCLASVPIRAITGPGEPVRFLDDKIAVDVAEAELPLLTVRSICDPFSRLSGGGAQMRAVARKVNLEERPECIALPEAGITG